LGKEPTPSLPLAFFMDLPSEKPLKIHLVNSTESPEFTHLTQSLTRSSIIGLDAEWKPIRGQTHQPTFPTVSLLQLACQLGHDSDESETFLLDLHSVPLPSIWELLRETFVSPDILKLGFKFKQDLVYLSSTFCLQGCDPGFDKVKTRFSYYVLFDFQENNLIFIDFKYCFCFYEVITEFFYHGCLVSEKRTILSLPFKYSFCLV
jgi:hypothetical protein